jgi:hypothetical protein
MSGTDVQENGVREAWIAGTRLSADRPKSSFIVTPKALGRPALIPMRKPGAQTSALATWLVRRGTLVANDPERDLNLDSGAGELLETLADGQFTWSGKFSLPRSEF